MLTPKRLRREDKWLAGHEQDQVQKLGRIFCSTRGHIPCLPTCAHVNRVAVFITAESSWQFVMAAALGEASYRRRSFEP